MYNEIDIEDISDDDLKLGSSFEDERENGNIHDDLPLHHTKDHVSSLVDKLQGKILLHGEADEHEVTFGSSIYTDAEIDKMEHDVEMAESEVIARKSDVSNWESKVSLNNTEEHKAKGDYANAVNHLNDAKSRYNAAVDRLNAAKAKLNNAR